MPKRAAVDSIEGAARMSSQREPWPEGRFVMVCRGAYPTAIQTRRGEWRNTVLVFDGLRDGAADADLDCPTWRVDGWPGDPGFEAMRTGDWKGVPGAADPFDGFVGTVALAQVAHSKPKERKQAARVYANIAMLWLLQTSEDVAAAAGMPADEVAAAFAAQPYAEPPRFRADLQAWLLDRSQQAAAAADPPTGSAPGVDDESDLPEAVRKVLAQARERG